MGSLRSLREVESCLFIHLFICFIYLFIYLFVYLFIYLFIYSFSYLFIYLSIYLFIYLIFLFFFLFFFDELSGTNGESKSTVIESYTFAIMQRRTAIAERGRKFLAVNIFLDRVLHSHHNRFHENRMQETSSAVSTKIWRDRRKDGLVDENPCENFCMQDRSF